MDMIAACVVNARFVKPLDDALILEEARTTGNIVTVEEHVLQGGFGSAMLELLQAHDMPHVKVRCLGLPARYIEQGSQQWLRRQYGLDADGLEQAALTLLRSI